MEYERQYLCIMGEIGAYKGKNAIRSAMAKARKVGPALQDFAETVAKWKGARVTPINYKSYESAKRKAKGEKRGIKDVRDLARTTIIASKRDVQGIVGQLKLGNKDFKMTRAKKQSTSSGYTGNLINLKHRRTGVEVEIQVNTPKMIYAKEKLSDGARILGAKTMKSIFKETKTPAGWGHSLYEQDRVRDNRGDAKKVRAQQLSRGYYSKFQ